MPKPNYRFAKQQRELAKKRRQVEKQQRFAGRAATQTGTDESGPAQPGTPSGNTSEP